MHFIWRKLTKQFSFYCKWKVECIYNNAGNRHQIWLLKNRVWLALPSLPYPVLSCPILQQPPFFMCRLWTLLCFSVWPMLPATCLFYLLGSTTKQGLSAKIDAAKSKIKCENKMKINWFFFSVFLSTFWAHLTFESKFPPSRRIRLMWKSSIGAPLSNIKPFLFQDIVF